MPTVPGHIRVAGAEQPNNEPPPLPVPAADPVIPGFTSPPVPVPDSGSGSGSSAEAPADAGPVDLDAILKNEAEASAYSGLASDVAQRAWEALATEDPEPLCGPPTLGTERIAWAPFAIESSRPRNMTVIGYDLMNNISNPDRAAFWWKQIGKGGPSTGETGLDLRELSLYHETGTDSASAFFRIPLRMLSPEQNPSTSGLGTIEIGAKTILFKGSDFFWIPTPGRPCDTFRISSVMRTYLSLAPTLADRGLQNGLTALEPGLLFAWDACPDLVFNGRAKLWIPIGADKEFAGTIFRWGAGASYVLGSTPVDTLDCMPCSLISTLEFHGVTYLGGRESVGTGTSPATRSVTRESVLNVTSGLRLSLGENVDLGLAGTANVLRRRIADNGVHVQLRFFR